jgi:hypothetical protein
VTEEVRALAGLDLAALRRVWRERIGPAPAMRSPDMLRLLLAWRIQVKAFGDLDAKIRRELRRSKPSPRPVGELPLGSSIVREWQGREHEVIAIEDGFAYGGARYRSLSEIARAITGVRWNGPRFFGLRAEREA